MFWLILQYVCTYFYFVLVQSIKYCIGKKYTYYVLVMGKPGHQSDLQCVLKLFVTVLVDPTYLV